MANLLPRLPVAAVAVGALAASLVLGNSGQTAAVPAFAPPLGSGYESVMTPLVPAQTTSLPSTPAGVAAALARPLASKALGEGPNIAVVLNAATGAVLFDQGGSIPATPASATKLLTAASVLNAYGTEHRITTQVVAGASASEIVLVGAGDPSMRVADPPPQEGPATTLTELADRTVAAIKLTGSAVTQPITLTFDDSLFTGPGKVPTWPTGYPMPSITALMTDNGKVKAETAFAKLLAARGIRISGKPVRGRAPAQARELAAVESAPMSVMVQQMVDRSDNVAAEMLARLAGLKLNGNGSFTGGAAAAIQTLQSLDLPTAGINLVDGSGLSREDKIPTMTLARLLVKVAANANPWLWVIGAGEPVAAFTGTLTDRFRAPRDASGRGVVRAKTGTLNYLSVLAGFVVNRDGELLVFALNAQKSEGDAAPIWDEAAANLAACGCR